MWKKILIVIIILGCIGYFMDCTGIGDSDKNSTNVSTQQVENNENKEDSSGISEKSATDSILYNRLYLPYKYAKEHNIEFPYFSEQERTAEKMSFDAFKACSWGQKVYLREDYGFFKKDAYIQTLEESDLCYWGELNGDCQPDGYGMIFEAGDLDITDMEYIVIQYIGEFKDGMYQGYGVSFENEDDNCIDPISVRYEGNFKEGKPSGKGIAFESTAASNYNESDGTLNEEKIEYAFFIGTFKEGQYDGSVKVYILGDLYYEGDCKNGQITGKGVEYFPDGSGKVRYKGEFYDAAYDGNGVLYDEDGNILHKGTFSNGDISN